jgi:hypothetical protein
MLDAHPAIATMAEARRRALPLHVSLILLGGGLATPILNTAAAIVWAAVMVGLTIADCELYRRLERDEISATPLALAGWGVLLGCVFVFLPGALALAGPWGFATTALVTAIALARSPARAVIWDNAFWLRRALTRLHDAMPRTPRQALQG